MRRTTRQILLSLLLVLGLGSSLPAAASASAGQLAVFDEPGLIGNPDATLSRLRLLGVGVARVFVVWDSIAPNPNSHKRPRGFRAADPAAYPAAKWTQLDALVRDAQTYGIQLDFTVTGGAPLWADGSGAPRDKPHPEWEPSPAEYGSFVRALGTRYSGTYPVGSFAPLPRITFWALWNEPNFGEDLAPQAINGSTVSVAPARYRSLVDQGWSALNGTGHAGDTILIGELAARGLSGPVSSGSPQGFPGNFAQTKPLQFIRTLYCVDSSFRALRGNYARARGCPTTGAGSSSFRAAHPGLFNATGFAAHPYPQSLPPTQEASSDPDYAAFSELPRLERELDRLQQMYGSATRFPIYNTEYGYITNPPHTAGRVHFVSPATAAYYINWAEYLSWRSPRIRTTMQYLLFDPAASSNGFASGLLFVSGAQKPAYNAYRLPLYLPNTSVHRGHSLEVWGAVRPAQFALLDTGVDQVAQIQFQPSSGGAWTTLRSLTITNSRGYFDTRVVFGSNGNVRLLWVNPGGSPVHSRVVQVSVH